MNSAPIDYFQLPNIFSWTRRSLESLYSDEPFIEHKNGPAICLNHHAKNGKTKLYFGGFGTLEEIKEPIFKEISINPDIVRWRNQFLHKDYIPTDSSEYRSPCPMFARASTFSYYD
jgi:hypothetical protein